MLRPGWLDQAAKRLSPKPRSRRAAGPLITPRPLHPALSEGAQISAEAKREKPPPPIPYERVLLEATPAPTRARILKAARELFYRYGIHTVSVDAIAEAVDTNKTTPCRHFASKDELVAECLRESGLQRRNPALERSSNVGKWYDIELQSISLLGTLPQLQFGTAATVTGHRNR